MYTQLSKCTQYYRIWAAARSWAWSLWQSWSWVIITHQSNEVTRREEPRGTYSYDFSYHLRFGKFWAMLATTGHTVGSVSFCMLKYRVKTTRTDKRHVVSFRWANFWKETPYFMFRDHLHAERHWYGCWSAEWAISHLYRLASSFLLRLLSMNARWYFHEKLLLANPLNAADFKSNRTHVCTHSCTGKFG